MTLKSFILLSFSLYHNSAGLKFRSGERSLRKNYTSFHHTIIAKKWLLESQTPTTSIYSKGNVLKKFRKKCEMIVSTESQEPNIFCMLLSQKNCWSLCISFIEYWRYAMLGQKIRFKIRFPLTLLQFDSINNRKDSPYFYWSWFHANRKQYKETKIW